MNRKKYFIKNLIKFILRLSLIYINDNFFRGNKVRESLENVLLDQIELGKMGFRI